MFSAFVSTSSGPSEPGDQRPVLTPPDSDSRPKRKQVSRACDWCRLHRVKCDPYFPCRNCEERAGYCSRKGTANRTSLPQALREIEKLRLHIRDLETGVGGRGKELGARDKSISDATIGASASEPSRPTPSSIKYASTIAPATSNYANIPQRRKWEGIYARCARSEQTSYYGPHSTLYFLTRVGAHLGKELQQTHLDQQLQPHSASNTFTTPESPDGETPSTDGADLAKHFPVSSQVRLSQRQEEYFLDLFWHLYQCTLPIVDEGEFRAHYKSLWAQPECPTRKPSPLVDIILALCMQYGFALRPSSIASSGSGTDLNDSTIAGRWFYRRSQGLLAADLESPSITTLQCQIYTVVYLCGASFQNMAHNTLSLAVRTAQILGLHLDPPLHLSQSARELRKRIWWVLSTLESKTCMKLGRPFSYQLSDVSCSMPLDDQEAAFVAGSTLGSYGADVTWLTYAVHCHKLILLSRQIYEVVYDYYAQALGSMGVNTPYEDPEALEACAVFLHSQMGRFQDWLDGVPESLKTKRREGGKPFSTDRSVLDIEHRAPIWLQRQCLCLELLYHTMLTNLYRPFITFSRRNGATTTAEGHASACINHAMAHTHIMHQVLSQTDLLNGWLETFQWQWNATITSIGFLLAYPIGPSTPAARRSIDKAIIAFELFGRNNVAVSVSAASVARDLVSKADQLIERFWTGLGVSSLERTPDALHTPPTNDGDQLGGRPPLESGPSTAMQEGSDDFSDFLDLALTVDSFHNFEDFFTESGNDSDFWGFGNATGI